MARYKGSERRAVAKRVRLRLPVSSPMFEDERDLIDAAAAVRELSRAEFIRQAAVRSARAVVAADTKGAAERGDAA